MGIFDSLIEMFGGGIKCPSCGTPGARKSENRIRCPNSLCGYFDPILASSRPVSPAQMVRPVPPAAATPRTPGSSISSAQTVTIQYRNFEGQSKVFTVDAKSVVRRNNHIVARLASSPQRVALARNRIQNIADVDLVLPERERSGAPRPSARERQVLGYHRKYGTTSPLHEKIKAKYPNW
jgi:hypothetical protein